MDWREYKRLCDSPHTFSRWMIEQSIELVADEPALMLVLQQALTGQALEKPAGHRGGVATDMFVLRLDLDQAGAVYRRIRTAVHVGQRTTATRQRGLGGFVAAWGEYVSFLERATVGAPSADRID
jgi:hypothetical protein